MRYVATDSETLDLGKNWNSNISSTEFYKGSHVELAPIGAADHLSK